MLNLPNVTLIALTSKDFSGHGHALDKSSEQIRFGDIKLIIRKDIQSIDDWNRIIIYELHKYVETEFCLLVHADGYVINPYSWRDEFLEYDYVGAPWPLPKDSYSYRSPYGSIVRVGNSVSLRSKKILELPSKLNLPWKSYYGNTNEDGFLCVHNKEVLESHGIRFAPLEVAKLFSREHEIPENKGINTFAFHMV